MSLEKQFMEDYKAAMKAGDKLRLETIRGIRAQLKNAQIEKKAPLNDEEIIALLKNAAKKRKEAIEQFSNLGRAERAAEESQELAIIESYLPEQMDETAIGKLVDAVISEVGAASVKDLGKVMGAVMARAKGQADGKIVQQIVREKLAGL